MPIPLTLYVFRECSDIDHPLEYDHILIFIGAFDMNVSDNNLNKLAVAMVGLFFVYALWEQFAPQASPGVAELTKANILVTSTSESDRQEACKLFGQAVRAGNKEAVFGLSDCIGQSKKGTPESRRALQYAVLTMAIPDILKPDEKPVKSSRDPVAERAALGCTPEEIKEASKIDVVKVLQGEESLTDFVFRALK